MRAAVFALAVVTASPAAAQSPGAEQERDKAAIVQVALDYAEGYYGGEPARMTRALSPYLSKRGLTVLPDGTSFLVQMNADTLIDVSNGAKLAAAERHIATEVLEITGDIASARVFTARFNDYLHLVKRNGAWQILNVLWHQPPPATAATAATSAVEQVVKDYSAALYAADSRRAIQVVHPVANLRAFAQPPNRPRVIVEQNPETLAAALAGGRMKYPGAPGDAKVVVQGVDADIAAAKLTMGPITTYLHLALQQGQWRVVNALAYPPAAGGPSGR